MNVSCCGLTKASKLAQAISEPFEASGMNRPSTWITCQIGAREHYAIPRALARSGQLGQVLTDFWIRPSEFAGKLPGLNRLRDRYHDDLSEALVASQNLPMLWLEGCQRFRRFGNWDRNMQRNAKFQKLALRQLEKSVRRFEGEVSLFAYSYAASGLFRFAKERGWKTVLGQIDPGPEEERIVGREHERYPHLASRWQPAPSSYWDSWREEVDLADRIVVNSDWSRQCLIKEGIAHGKLETIPLVYQSPKSRPFHADKKASTENKGSIRLLFLGQVNLRKGMGRLLDAMRLLKDEQVELALVGPSEIPASEWRDLPKVSWSGPVPRSEVSGYYERADAFILPTLSDGYAITQLEALSFGLPTIASRNCGSAVTDGVNGMVLANLEPETIASTILDLGKHSFPEVMPPTFGLEDLAEALLRPNRVTL